MTPRSCHEIDIATSLLARDMGWCSCPQVWTNIRTAYKIDCHSHAIGASNRAILLRENNERHAVGGDENVVEGDVTMTRSDGFLRYFALATLLFVSNLLMSGASVAQDLKSRATLTVPAIVLIEQMVETSIPIQVGPIDALPRNCFVRVKGLPPQALFSDGHVVSSGTWALPIAGLNDLKLTVPLSTSGRSDLQLTLLAIDGTVLAEAKVTLAVTAGTLASPGVALAPAIVRPPSASLGPPEREIAQPVRPPVQRVEPPTAPAMKPEDRERATMFLTRANSMMAGGDIASARQLYQRAADAGLAEAAIAMGATFDPVELNRLGVQGMKGDPEIARKWYERARALGAQGAEERLRRVGSP